MNCDCKRCKYADFSSGSRTIKMGNTVIVQKGANNIRCTKDFVASIDFTGNQMICSSFEPREK